MQFSNECCPTFVIRDIAQMEGWANLPFEDEGHTPLALAVLSGDADLVRYLLSAGANPEPVLESTVRHMSEPALLEMLQVCM